MPALDQPNDPLGLYVAQGDDVNLHRPLFTGDVLEELVIPGVDEPGPAILIDHPCSMRHRHKLRPRILAARILPNAAVMGGGWPTESFYDWFPLPELVPGTNDLAVKLDLVGRVEAEGLAEIPRLACLSLAGVSLLWQRKVHRDTRFVVPRDRLVALIEPPFEEAELWEEWAQAFVPPSVSGGETLEGAIESAGKDFADFLDANGHREALADQSRRPTVRRAVRAEIRARTS